jgi:nitrogen fixation-related uncharacterized protein
MDTTTLVLLIFITAVVVVGIGGFLWALNKED